MKFKELKFKYHRKNQIRKMLKKYTRENIRYTLAIIYFITKMYNNKEIKE